MVVVPLTAALWVTHPDLDAELFAAPVAGLVPICGLVRVEPPASAPIEEIVDALPSLFQVAPTDPLLVGPSLVQGGPPANPNQCRGEEQGAGQEGHDER